MSPNVQNTAALVSCTSGCAGYGRQLFSIYSVCGFCVCAGFKESVVYTQRCGLRVGYL